MGSLPLFPERYAHLLSRKRPAPADYIVIGAALFAAFFWMRNFTDTVVSAVPGQVRIEVRQEDRLLFSSPLDLANHRIFDIPIKGIDMKVEQSGSGIRILPMDKDDCPLGICSRSGWISRPGEALFCIPNRVSVSISANDPAIAGVDAVAR